MHIDMMRPASLIAKMTPYACHAKLQKPSESSMFFPSAHMYKLATAVMSRLIISCACCIF